MRIPSAQRYLWLGALGVMTSWAWPPEFAPEFNFENFKIRQAWLKQKDRNDTENPVNAQYRDEWAHEVRKTCPECNLTRMKDRYDVDKIRVTYPDGWWFEITLDPSTVEIVSKPATLKKFQELKPRLERDVWKVASQLKLLPQGAGHINVGAESAFGQDALLFRNFIVDQANHYELAAGIQSEDWHNAPHVEHLRNDQSQAFAKIVGEFDPQHETKEILAKKIYEEVYHTATWNTAIQGENPHKYQALNISTLAEGESPWRRVELRATRMQSSMDEFLAGIRLIEERLNFLKTQKKPLRYQGWRFAKTQITQAQALSRYYEYVKNSGLDWAEYKKLLPSKYNRAITLFERSLGACKAAMSSVVSPDL